MASRPLRVLVTAGGTKVKIDDVRVLTNRSRGRFPAAIAEAFLAEQAEVTVLASEELVERLQLEGRYAAFHRVVSYTWFEDYEASLFEILRDWEPDIILLGAAVSDWLNAQSTSGKMRSDQDEMTITLVKAPKLIERVRAVAGKRAFVVGFKMLAGSSREELITAAQHQLKKCRLHLTIANDLSHLREGHHPVVLVLPEGGEIELVGLREDVAKQIAAFVLERQSVRWSTTYFVPKTFQLTQDREAQTQVETLLSLAQSMHLFPDCSGNGSVRAKDGRGFWVSPRGVPKQEVTPDDLIYVQTDSAKHLVWAQGIVKPSIDSAVQGKLYERFPWVDAILHFHKGYAFAAASTQKAFPCGTLEEAEEITRAIMRTNHCSDGTLIELVHHGFVLVLSRAAILRLVRDWSEITAEYIKHLVAVGQGHLLDQLELSPVFMGVRIGGVVAKHVSEPWVSCYLRSDWRHRGFGQKLVARLATEQVCVKTHEDCQVVDYYLAHGWQIKDRDGSMVLLEPPCSD